jgi:transposase
MARKLLSSERIDLINRHKKTRDKRECDRIKAVLLFDQDYSYSEIAKILLLDDETIRRHVKEYFDSHKLAPENGGSDSYLNASQTASLLSHLREVTYLHVKDICAYVKQTYRVNYGISGMTKWLNVNGFCYKKPHGVPARADAEKQAAFREYYAELKASLSKDEVLYFVDSSHPQHQTQLAYGWIAKGVRKSVKMTACQKRVNLIGGINLQGHQIEYRHVDWVNFESISAFLTQLQAANPTAGKIHIIWDNAGYHKSGDMKAFVENTNLQLHFLPPYSPNLNPIERLWKILHEQVTYNKYYDKLRDFTEAIVGFFDNIEQYQQIIKQRVNDNFQQLASA